MAKVPVTILSRIVLKNCEKIKTFPDKETLKFITTILAQQEMIGVLRVEIK